MVKKRNICNDCGQKHEECDCPGCYNCGDRVGKSLIVKLEISKGHHREFCSVKCAKTWVKRNIEVAEVDLAFWTNWLRIIEKTERRGKK